MLFGLRQASRRLTNQDDLDPVKLQNHLPLLHDAIQLQVTSIRIIVDAMNMYSSEVYMQVHVIRGEHVNSAIPHHTCYYYYLGKSLFCVEMVVNIRSTMTEKGLNNCFFLHVHKEITDTLELTDIPKQFTAMHPERKKYFGTLVAKVMMTVLTRPL